MINVKVTPIISETGNIVKNHYIIHVEGGKFLQSYEDIVAYKPDDFNEKVVLDVGNWDASPTTRKWREKFLGESHLQTLVELSSGDYEMKDLNDMEVE